MNGGQQRPSFVSMFVIEQETWFVLFFWSYQQQMPSLTTTTIFL